MKLTVKNISGQNAGELEVKFAMITDGRGTQAVHDTVVAYRAAQRAGTACTKNAGDVAGTNKKPWRQKGTGRARAGSFQSPLWRGGGVVFGPKPRDFTKKVNAQTRKLALRKAFSERLKAGEVTVVDDFNLSAPKTKEFLKAIGALKLDGGTIVLVTNGDNKNLLLAARNVTSITLVTADVLTTYQVLLPKNLLFTRGAYEKFEKRLAE